MNQNRIIIDESALRRNTSAFLRSPAAAPIYEELDTPWWVCLIGTGIIGVAGVLMLPTIVWTRNGLRALWSVAKLEPFQALAANPSRNPDALAPLIGHGVIIGPDQRHALVLGTFQSPSEYSVDWVAQQADRFGRLYSTGPDDPGEESLYELLQDDVYRPYRRRRVPAEHGGGVDLMLFDVEVDLREGRKTCYDTILFAFIAVPGEEGVIAAAPWAVAAPAVRIDGA